VHPAALANHPPKAHFQPHPADCQYSDNLVKKIAAANDVLSMAAGRTPLQFLSASRRTITPTATFTLGKSSCANSFPPIAAGKYFLCPHEIPDLLPS
jgi:hypothetical protein